MKIKYKRGSVLKKIILALCVTVFVATGCTKHAVDQTANQQNIASQKIINELKNGVSIYFKTNSSEIETKYQIYLATAAQGLAQNQNFVLELEGHTDSSGSASANRKISLERANAVRNKLVLDYNVNPEQVKASGVGSANPIDTNNTAEGRANNRRVSATLKIK